MIRRSSSSKGSRSAQYDALSRAENASGSSALSCSVCAALRLPSSAASSQVREPSASKARSWVAGGGEAYPLRGRRTGKRRVPRAFLWRRRSPSRTEEGCRARRSWGADLPKAWRTRASLARAAYASVLSSAPNQAASKERESALENLRACGCASASGVCWTDKKASGSAVSVVNVSLVVPGSVTCSKTAATWGSFSRFKAREQVFQGDGKRAAGREARAHPPQKLVGSVARRGPPLLRDGRPARPALSCTGARAGAEAPGSTPFCFCHVYPR